MMSDQVREARLRRIAKRQGFLLQKSHRRDSRAVDYGLYRLVASDTRELVLGSSRTCPFQMNLDLVEQFLTGRVAFSTGFRCNLAALSRLCRGLLLHV